MSGRINLRALMLISLSAAALIGCTLEEAESKGEMCPPQSARLEDLSYIQLGKDSVCKNGANCYTIAFMHKVCPYEHDTCYYDSNEEYYCMQRCPGSQIACNGKCIDPMHDTEYCGAVNECEDIDAGCCTGYKKCSEWETCVSGECVERACPQGARRCTDGIVYKCDGTWKEEQRCASRMCKPGTNECMNEARCQSAEGTISHGFLTCSSDLSSVMICDNGTLREQEKCRGEMKCLKGVNTACGIPVYDTCRFNEKEIQSGEFICDGNMVRGCVDGKLDKGYECALDGKTMCRNGKCVEPSCLYKGQNLKAGESVCEGNKLVTCQENGEMNAGTDCAANTDGKIICRINQCEEPKNCMLGNATIKSGASACNEKGEVVTCEDGSIKVTEDCLRKGRKCTLISDMPQCVPAFETIKDLRRDFDKMYPQAVCSGSEENFIDVALDVTGVVTALREKSGNYGFVFQDIAGDPEYSGALVNCKTAECQTYTDAEGKKIRIKVGDTVRVRSNQINSYYCQLQIYQNGGSVTVEKVDASHEIKPVDITAADIDTAAEYEPNNPYNSVLVRVKGVTVGDWRGDKKPHAWLAKDIDGSDLQVSDAVYIKTAADEPDLDTALTSSRTYDFTGVGVWTFNQSVLAPRSKADIAEVPDCLPEQNGKVCLKRKGAQWVTTCNAGVRDTASDQDCTGSGMTCDTDGGAHCRKPGLCHDYQSNSIPEGEQGCFDNKTLKTCGFAAGCTEGDCGEWSSSATECANGCNATEKRCNAPALEKCGFVALDDKLLKASVRVQDVPNADVDVKILCTDDPSLPLAQWITSAPLIRNESCADCVPGVSEYVTKNGMLPIEDGAYTCVASVSVENGSSYVCPSELGYAEEIDNKLEILPEWTHEYAVGTQSIALASWNFNGEACMAMSDGIKTNSSFELVGGTAQCSDKYVASQSLWSKSVESDFENAPYWKITLETKGYRDISLAFKMRSSKESSVIAAYKIGDGTFKPFGNDLSCPKDLTYPVTLLPEEAADQEQLIIGLFPHNMKYSAPSASTAPNVRIDDLTIKGLPLNN